MYLHQVIQYLCWAYYMIDIIEADLAWLAGIVDAEGSIDLSRKRCKRGKYTVTVRIARMRIKTCDMVVVPRIAAWFNVMVSKHAPINTLHSESSTVTIAGRRLREFLPIIIPHLYIKQPQAKIALDALNIKAGKATPYSLAESIAWDELYNKMRELNSDGRQAPIDNQPRDHQFSWAWLAGLVDGDGSITVGRFGIGGRTRKPVLKISLTHRPTIKYLASVLGRAELKSGGGVGNKRLTTSIRLMSNDLLRILPEIVPYLAIKGRHAELALQIARLRVTMPGGQWNHPNVAIARQLLDQLDMINSMSKKSRRS